MSGNHCEVRKAVSRGKGQSVVAKAAYNARTQLDNERFGEKTANYGRKGQDKVLLSGIFVDPKLKSPDWTQDRNRLWNEAANAEGTTKNAREGQEIIAALPHQLTDQQREFIAIDFARELARSTGRVIDVNIHRPPANGDDRNYHVHMLMTVREIGPNGFGEKLPEIGKADIRAIKERWSERGARELRKAGFEIEADRWAVGHLKQEEQLKDALRRGDLEFAQEKEKGAGKHLGPNVAAMEAKGIETDRGNIERQKLAAAQEVLKLKAELTVIEKEISQEVSAFVEQQERETWGGGSVEEDREAHRRPKAPDLNEVNREIARILEQQERALGNFDALVASHPSLHPDWRDEKLYVDWLLQRREMREEEKDQQRTLDYVDALIADAPQRMAEQRQGGIQPLSPAMRHDAELRGTAAEIRLAYSLTATGQQFADALEDRGFILARMTAEDIEKLEPKKEAPKETPRPTTVRPFKLSPDLFERAAHQVGDHMTEAEAVKFKQKQEAQKEPSTQEQTRPLSWMASKGGVSKLSPELLESAKRSYGKWDEKLQERYSFEDYVSYTQGVHVPEVQAPAPEPVVSQPKTSRYAVGELVVINQRGEIYTLTDQNTGKNIHDRNERLKSVDREALLSVTDARRVMGDVYQQRLQETKIQRQIEINERYSPTTPPEQHAVKTSPAYHFEDGARSLTMDTAPLGRIPDNLKGTAADIWNAYNIRTHEQQWKETQKDGSKIDREQTINLKAGRDPHQFAQALEAKGIRLAQVTKDEAERSRTAAPFAKAVGNYAPLLREGELVAVDKRGSVYQFSQHTTGAKPWEVQQFLKKVEWKDIRSVTETAQQERPQQHTRPQGLRATAAEIWDAHQGATTAAQFVKKFSDYAKVLDKQSLVVAVVAEGDKDIAQRQATGAFVVVDQRGHIYALNERTTGRSEADAQKFMRASLNPRQFMNVTAARQFQITKAQELRTKKGLERSDSAIAWGRGERPTTVRSVWSGAKFATKRTVSQTKATIAPATILKKPAESIGRMLGGLFSALVPDPPKTPEQIAHIEKKAEQNEIQWSKFVYNTDHERAIASQQEQARYRQEEAENWKKDRDRDGRDR